MPDPTSTSSNGDSPKLRLDPSQLTMRDLKRARSGPLDGRNPFELLEDPLDAVTLAIWCLRSRTDPEFTWDAADDMSIGEFDMPADEDGTPPPMASPAPSGKPTARRGEANGATSSAPKRSSAASTG